MSTQKTNEIIKMAEVIQQKYTNAVKVTSEEEIKPFKHTFYPNDDVYILYIPKCCLIEISTNNWNNGIQVILYKCQPRGEFVYHTQTDYPQHKDWIFDQIASFKVYSDDDIKKAQSAQTKRAKNAWVQVGYYDAVLAGIKKYRIKMYHQNKLKSLQDPEVDVKIRVDVWYDKGGKYEDQKYIHDVEFDIENAKFLNENVSGLPNSKECGKEIVEHIKDIKTY